MTEGSSEDKLNTIMHSVYLHKGLRSLTKCTGGLFVHGHGLGENDAHVLRAVVEGKIDAVYVSLHGDPNSENYRDICQRAELLAARRRDSRSLDVQFYDADSAHVWDRP